MRSHVQILAAITAFALALSACSSAHKRAAKLLEDGNFMEAATQYEQILAKNPKDEDAIAGLKKARAGWMDRRLIDVRMTRLAGRSEDAGEILLEVISKQALWQSVPAGNQAFTQQEESSYFAEASSVRIERDLKNTMPLRAEYYLKHFEPILLAANPGKLKQWREKVHTQGKSACTARTTEVTSSKSSSKIYFYRRFLNRYCQYWNSESQAKLKSKIATEPLDDEGKRIRFFRSLTLQIASPASSLNEVRTALLKTRLDEAFKATAWYDDASTEPLAVPLSVRWIEDHRQTHLPQRHIYQVQEPFTEYVQVQKERSVPYTEMRRTQDPSTPGLMREMPVTSYRTELYTVTEPKTVHRPVDRIYTYDAIFHDQNLEIDLGTEFEFQGRAVSARQSMKASAEGIEHHESQPTIGLKPSSPQLIFVDLWIAENTQKFANKWESALSQAWVDQYCHEAAAGDPLQAAERALRCLKQRRDVYTPFAETWFQNQFGLRITESDSIVSVH